MENMILISNKFLDQINALLIMADKEVVRIPTVKKENSLNDLFDSIIRYKTIKLSVEGNENNENNESDSFEEHNLNQRQTEFMIKMEELIRENDILRYIDKNVDVEIHDDGLRISTKTIFADRLVEKFIKNNQYMNTEDELYNNSLIMSLATAFELLISDLIKDYAKSNKNPNFFNNYKIDFKTLAEIGDVEIAREYLIDRYIENVLRNSVSDWIFELEKINNKINFNEFQEHYILLIETFQRRHLLVHNNGIVNSLYLSKVDPSLTQDIMQGAQLESSTEYIINRVKTFREIGLILLFKYFSLIYRDRLDEVYNTLEEHIIDRIPRNCIATQNIFKIVTNDQKYGDTIRTLAKINYWLSKKFNDKFEEVIQDVKQFDISTLQPQYQMAKYLLLDKQEEAFTRFLEYSKSIDPDELVFIFDWPLLKLFKGFDKYKEFRNSHMDSIIKEAGSVLDDEH